MTARISPHVQSENQQPVVLIGGDTQFIGYYLHQFLVQQDCRVIFLNKLNQRKIKRVDYVFSLMEKRAKEVTALLKITKNFKAKFLLATMTKGEPIENLAKDAFQKEELDGRIVQLENVYGPRMDYGQYQELLQLIKVVKIKPIFVADAVYSLVKAMFGGGTAGKTFTLDRQGSLAWRPAVELEEGLRQTEKWFGKRGASESEKWDRHSFPRPTARPSPVKNSLHPVKYLDGQASHLSLLIPVFLLIAILSYPFISPAFNGFLGMRNLRKTQEAVLAADFSKAGEVSQKAEAYLRQSANGVDRLAFLLNAFNQGSTVYRIQKILDLGIAMARGINYTAQATEQAGELGRVVFQKNAGGIEALVAEIETDLDVACSQLSLVQATVESDPTLLQLAGRLGFSGKTEDIVEGLSATRELMNQAVKGMPLVPALIGLYKKTTFLVLLQNNMELRPTGGFIGSYALLTFDKGRLLDFEVRDVYSADGQLKGYVEPPSDLKKHLGEAGWYLRDSNWDPDFPTSAVKAAWFLEKETGRTVDGVLGINLFVAQKILEAVGEVEVADYQEKINSQNLFERAEYHAETNFFPGSTQKQDFLGSLARSLFEKIKASDRQAWLKIAKTTYQSLRAKDILVYLKDQEAMGIVTALNWDGAMRDITCLSRVPTSRRDSRSGEESATCYVDYLMIVESNVGVNKANYFVKRQLTHHIQLGGNGTVQEVLKINYQNESQADVFPAGGYKNYLRIYVPLKSKLLQVVVTDPATGSREDIGSEKREVKEEHGRTVFSFLVEIPIKEEKTVEINYKLAEKLPAEEAAQYLFLLQKQPGIQDEEFRFWLKSEGDLEIISAEPRGSVIDKSAAFIPRLDQDLVFEVRMAR